MPALIMMQKPINRAKYVASGGGAVAPTLSSPTMGSTTASVAFTGGSGYTTLIPQYSLDASSWTSITNDTVSPFNFTGLTASTLYYFRALADGVTASNTVSGTTTALGVLPLLIVTGTAGAGEIKWDLTATYAGASRVPTGNYGAVGRNNLFYCSDPLLAIGSASNRLVIVGRNGGEVVTTLAEFQFSSWGMGGTLSSLPIASNTQGFIEVLTNAPVDGESWSGRMIGGIANIGGKLVVNAYGYYTGTNRPTMVVDNIASLSTTTFKGYFDHTDRQQSGGWCTPIPTSYQSALGGTHLFGFSMSGRRAILTKYSIGPSAYVYDFNASGSITGATPPSNGSTLTPTKVLDYPDTDHGLNGATSLGGTGGRWTYVSGGQIGIILPGTRTYMVIGTSAGHVSGSSYYDPAPYDASFKGYAPVDQNDIYNYIWLFDVDDLLAVKAGTKQPYEVVPYYNAPISFPFDGGAGWFNIHRVQGITYNPADGYFYISLEYGDNSQGGESPLPLVIRYDMSGFA